jgi:hypothetical protein
MPGVAVLQFSTVIFLPFFSVGGHSLPLDKYFPAMNAVGSGVIRGADCVQF